MMKSVCAPAAATLASMAGNETVAGFIMNSPGDSVAKTVMTLLEVRVPVHLPYKVDSHSFCSGQLLGMTAWQTQAAAACESSQR
jgi:hypothetical protein